jgi:hypothetical protein
MGQPSTGKSLLKETMVTLISTDPRAKKKITSQLLVKTDKVFWLPLMRNIIKAMDQNSSGFLYLKQKFPRISKTKIKDGTSVGP